MNQLVDIFVSVYSKLDPAVINAVIQLLITLSPIVLAWILLIIFVPLWVDYVQSDFIASLKYTLLDIKLPKDIYKSPLAMEVFLNALHNTADGGNYAKYWKGEKRPTYSLEIISVEGNIKFIIRTEDRRKAGVMSALYSQFPGIEVSEIEDYTYGVQFNPKEMKLWGGEFVLTQPDPYPIKTYVDYGLDKDPKEEYKVDPLTPLIEYLGNVGMNQQVWIQYIIRAHIKEQRKPGHLFEKTDAWKDEAKKIVNEIMIRDSKTKVSGMKDEKTGFTKLPSISEGETEIVKAIERSISKQAFDVGIRAIYFGKKDFFDKPNGIGGIVGGFKHFSSENLNGFKPNGSKWSPRFKNTPWEDYKKMRENKSCKLVLDAYKRRSFFYAPYKSKPIVLNIEELATIFHFPGQVASAPTLYRVPSKKGQSPSNLPI